MIAGIGIDIVDMARLEKAWNRFGLRFLKHFLSSDEISALACPPSLAFLAGRFAAKEAAVKALGTGFQLGITPQMIEIRNNALGCPELFFNGKAHDRAQRMEVSRSHITITHEREYAVGLVILEAE